MENSSKGKICNTYVNLHNFENYKVGVFNCFSQKLKFANVFAYKSPKREKQWKYFKL
jgi:hypothetical protein